MALKKKKVVLLHGANKQDSWSVSSRGFQEEDDFYYYVPKELSLPFDSSFILVANLVAIRKSISGVFLKCNTHLNQRKLSFFVKDKSDHGIYMGL